MNSSLNGREKLKFANQLATFGTLIFLGVYALVAFFHYNIIVNWLFIFQGNIYPSLLTQIKITIYIILLTI